LSNQILKLAKEHQVKCAFGRFKIDGKANSYGHKESNCQMCNRKMTVPKPAHKPHFCYKCSPEVEATEQALR
jgi:hypothetical protein